MKHILRKSFALFSLLALVAMPIMASAITYNPPITINNPTPVQEDFGYSVSIDGNKFIVGAPENNTGGSSAGQAYLFDVTTGALLQTFNNPTPAFGDGFGYSVSISGDKVLISAPYDDTEATNAGSAYLYDATTGALLQTFNNPTPAVGDLFGWSVSIYGDKVLIGAPRDNTGAPTSGSAYLYDATTGTLLQSFYNPTPAMDDFFGYSVSISGDKVLIGASNAGTAYLFDVTTGALLQTFNNPTPLAGSGFGASVSMSGDRVLIGAFAIGSAYLFDATTGALLQTFNNPDGTTGGFFGWSVSLSGDKVLIGAYRDDTGATDTGSAYLYNATTGGALLYIFNNPTPEYNDFFGHSVSISGTTVLVGAYNDKIGALEAGSAYLYLAQTDTDGDDIEDGVDNCPADANANQTDTDGDGQGHICDFTPNGDLNGNPTNTDQSAGGSATAIRTSDA